MSTTLPAKISRIKTHINSMSVAPTVFNAESSHVLSTAIPKHDSSSARPTTLDKGVSCHLATKVMTQLAGVPRLDRPHLWCCTLGACDVDGFCSSVLALFYVELDGLVLAETSEAFGVYIALHSTTKEQA